MKTQCLQTNETQHYCRKERCLRSGGGRESVALIKSLITWDRKDALEARLSKSSWKCQLILAFLHIHIHLNIHIHTNIHIHVHINIHIQLSLVFRSGYILLLSLQIKMHILTRNLAFWLILHLLITKFADTKTADTDVCLYFYNNVWFFFYNLSLIFVQCKTAKYNIIFLVEL